VEHVSQVPAPVVQVVQPGIAATQVAEQLDFATLRNFPTSQVSQWVVSALQVMQSVIAAAPAQLAAEVKAISNATEKRTKSLFIDLLRIVVCLIITNDTLSFI
jgi:hypothetical protein